LVRISPIRQFSTVRLIHILFGGLFLVGRDWCAFHQSANLVWFN
jgi:hypothetical protein